MFGKDIEQNMPCMYYEGINGLGLPGRRLYLWVTGGFSLSRGKDEVHALMLHHQHFYEVFFLTLSLHDLIDVGEK